MPEDDPGGQAELEHAAGRGPGAVFVVGAEELADERLAGDRDRVEREREERPDLERDLVRGDRDVRDAGGDRGGQEQREQQRAGAHDEVAADDRRGLHARGSRRDRRARASGADRRTITRNATAASTCAATVPHAEPAMPRSSP